MGFDSQNDCQSFDFNGDSPSGVQSPAGPHGTLDFLRSPFGRIGSLLSNDPFLPKPFPSYNVGNSNFHIGELLWLFLNTEWLRPNDLIQSDRPRYHCMDFRIEDRFQWLVCKIRWPLRIFQNDSSPNLKRYRPRVWDRRQSIFDKEESPLQLTLYFGPDRLF